MTKSRQKPYGPALSRLMAEKTKVLSQAHAFSQMGLAQTAEPLWQAAGELEEHIAPRLDAIGRNSEAALHRVSAASCYRNAGEFSRATNLFQAALAGPLENAVRADVERFLEECLSELSASLSRKPVTV